MREPTTIELCIATCVAGVAIWLGFHYYAANRMLSPEDTRCTLTIADMSTPKASQEARADFMKRRCAGVTIQLPLIGPLRFMRPEYLTAEERRLQEQRLGGLQQFGREAAAIFGR